MEYGLVLYDVPSGDMKSYLKIRRALRGRSLRINLSCYLFDWNYRQQLIELRQNLPNTIDLRIAKFDKESETSINEMVKLSFSKFVSQTLKTLDKYIKEAKEEIFNQYKQDKLEEALSVATIFGLGEDIKDFQETIKTLTFVVLGKQE